MRPCLSPTLIRIDDISLNVNRDRLMRFIEQIQTVDSNIKIMLAISPLVFNMKKNFPDDTRVHERVFPSILNAYSDFREFYKVERIGLPEWLEELRSLDNVCFASHGLVHVDHRLLDKSAQEMSILTSTSFISTNIFVPPFNKYNESTEAICNLAGIELIKWEDGWKHLCYQTFQNDGSYYYIHLHDYPGDSLFSILK